MPGKENVLVVVDPSRGIHPALERAIVNAQIREEMEESNLIVLVTPESEAASDSPVMAFQTPSWLTSLVAPIEEAGLSYQLELCWTSSWAQALSATINRHQVDLIMLPFYGTQNSNVLSNEKWRFLRNSQIPALLIRPGSDPSRSTILATIKSQDKNYQDLNTKILGRGKWAAERYNAQLHVVNTYSDSLNFPDRSAIAKQAGVPNNCIHVKQGTPDQVIPSLAKELNADTILIGMRRRSGLKGALRGNTIEKIIDDIPQDIMMLV